jgi:hypothetical protein
MEVELDHVFICVKRVAPEAEQVAFMPFMRRFHHEQRFAVHPNGACEFTALTLTTTTVTVFRFPSID